ncbi:hypothetical protein AOQ84DRAFT_397047 [Glonium stellatum]|uniref:Zn(2)-C6 fungal-type domain-containing protein n=1 Tax=Glonium stellatum TaxID=574774 RepID=A0A8E2F3R7_9PEZI|nr:hypothetical protein AOQ84DRAFT_397047 [Glonium stellatum]
MTMPRPRDLNPSFLVSPICKQRGSIFLISTTGLAFTCKARHTRCDEKKPVCSNCERLGLQCRASEFITRSAWCLPEDDSSRQQENFTSTGDSQDAHPFGPPTSTWDIFRSSLPDPNSSDSAQASSVSSSQALSPATPLLTLPAAPQPTVPLNSEMVYLLNTYRSGIAAWMDVFDHNCTYQRVVCQRALVSELLLRCVCAFAAKQLCLLPSGEIWTSVATKYYSQSLNLLIKQLNNPEPQSDALTAVMLLSSFEMLMDQSQDHRRHYEGAMKLIRTQGISARSIGLDRANFWIWIRHEIIVALWNESPLQLSPKYWNISWREGETEEDVLGHQLLWLVGRAIDWSYANGTSAEYQDLTNDVERWYAGLSPSFRGVPFGGSIGDGLSMVHFAVPAAAAAMIWYHLLRIVLYTVPIFRDPTYLLKNTPPR